MKMITLIFLLMFCVTANANWFPIGKSGAKTVYTKQSDCVSAEGQACFDITEVDLRYHSLQMVEVDDTDKPMWKTNYDVESCQDFSDCDLIAGTKQCTDEPGDIPKTIENQLMPGFSVVCTRLLGYEKKEVLQLVLDENMRTQILAEDIAKQQTADAVASVKQQMECGKTIQAQMAIRNVQKGLTTDQVNTFVQTYATIKNLLDAGAIATAKAQLTAMTPDGTITTQADKDAMLVLMEVCLGQ